MPRTRTSGQGRPKGAKNKRTLAQEAKSLDAGPQPLDYLLKIMQDETLPPSYRIQAATAAASYIHSKPAIEQKHSGIVGFRRMEDVIVDPNG